MNHSSLASYSKLLEKSPRKSFHDSDTASLSDEANFQHERFLPSSRTRWLKQVVTGFVVTLAATYVLGSLAFMSAMYRRGEFHLRVPDPPYSA